MSLSFPRVQLGGDARMSPRSSLEGTVTPRVRLLTPGLEQQRLRNTGSQFQPRCRLKRKGMLSQLLTRLPPGSLCPWEDGGSASEAQPLW